MRQFILAGNVAYGSSFPLAKGAVAFTYLNNGVPTIDSDGSKLHEPINGNIVLGRGDEGDVVLPFFNNHFSWVKAVYANGTTFNAVMTVTAPDDYSDCTVLIVKKGKKFNERNRWTATVHSGKSMTAAQLATALAKQVNNNTDAHGLIATVSNAQITFTGKEMGDNYSVIPADELTGTTVTVNTEGYPKEFDAKVIKDLADKAAADAGYEYTYEEDSGYKYYHLNPLAKDDSADTGFTVFTLRFAEPRQTGQLDKLVHQIVQIAFPTGAAAIATVESILTGIKNGVSE